MTDSSRAFRAVTTGSVATVQNLTEGITSRKGGAGGAAAHEAEDAGAVVAVPLHLAADARAPDHFHPDDTGYAAIAADFTIAILARRDPPGLTRPEGV
jgi:hypothetical protein